MEQSGQAELETARLTLRPLTRCDEDNLFTLYGDPRVMEIRRIGTQTREESDQRLQAHLDQWRRRGFGSWAVFHQQNGEFIGDCGFRENLHGSNDSEMQEIALSYGLTPEYWGKGLTTEAARAVLDYGFSELGFDAVYAMSENDNRASLRILEKLGFIYCCDFKLGEKVVKRTRLSRTDWEKWDTL